MASLLYKLEPLYRYFPEVKGPKRHVSFKEKLLWVVVVLLLFFVMKHITPIGVNKGIANVNFGIMQTVFASSMGSLMSIGIGPIVTASIILQLLVGSGMIGLDLQNKEDRAVFQGTQKLLVLVVAFFESFVMVKSGYIPPIDPGLGNVLFVALQIAGASVMLMFLDEVVSKWGIGSGIGLFIAAGVSARIISQGFAFTKILEAFGKSDDIMLQPGGDITKFILGIVSSGASGFNPGLLYKPLMTVVIFLFVVYAESLKIEIPLSYGRFGVGARYPLRFFYTSNIPVILAGAVLANVALMGNIVGIHPGEATSIANGGVVFLLSQYGINGILTPGRISTLFFADSIIHLLVYSFVFISLCVAFGVFWSLMSNMGSDSVAEQMEASGMQIPGFRADKRVIKRVLDRYIPQLIVVSSVMVGLLAIVADLFGAYGTGTGILLTVGILYRMYEEIEKEQISELSPAMRKLVGSGAKI